MNVDKDTNTTSHVCATTDGGAVALAELDFRRQKGRMYPGFKLRTQKAKTTIRIAWVFHDSKREAWVGPVEGGVSTQDPATYAFGCESGVGALTLIGDGDTKISLERVRCTPSGCQNQFALLTTDRVEEWHAVHDFGDKVLLVWSSYSRVKMRLAPFEELSHTPDRFLFSRVPPGEPFHILSFIEDTSAVILLGERAGADTQAVQITRSGKVAVIPRAVFTGGCGPHVY
jgi:hypothetical protein